MSRTKLPEQQYRFSKELTKNVKYKPVILNLPAAHPKQYEMIHSIDEPGHRFVCGACGTKFGASAPRL